MSLPIFVVLISKIFAKKGRTKINKEQPKQNVPNCWGWGMEV